MVDHPTPSGATASLLTALSPQRKGDSPKKRAQLNQAPAFFPPCETLATPNSSTSGFWTGTNDKLEEDPDGDENEEKDSINRMVSNRSAGWTSPFVLPKGTGTTFQEYFHFPHIIWILQLVFDNISTDPDILLPRHWYLLEINPATLGGRSTANQ
jgi:hypothetical protein